MGLDMYLMANKAIDAEAVFGSAGVPAEEDLRYLPMWSHTSVASRERAEGILTQVGMMELLTPDSPWAEINETGTEISVCCLYWRKDNAIHRWFVEKCQQGVDDCGTYPVHPEQLAALRSTCLKAAQCYDAGDMELVYEILPPQSGFFFGGTELDEWYRESLARTAEEIESVIAKAIQAKGVTFSYHSSW